METTNSYGNVSWAGYTNATVDSDDQGGGDGTITPEKLIKLVIMYGKMLIKMAYKEQMLMRNQLVMC